MDASQTHVAHHRDNHCGRLCGLLPSHLGFTDMHMSVAAAGATSTAAIVTIGIGTALEGICHAAGYSTNIMKVLASKGNRRADIEILNILRTVTVMDFFEGFQCCCLFLKIRFPLCSATFSECRSTLAPTSSRSVGGGAGRLRAARSSIGLAVPGRERVFKIPNPHFPNPLLESSKCQNPL
jgi:hypothetical protein